MSTFWEIAKFLGTGYIYWTITSALVVRFLIHISTGAIASNRMEPEKHAKSIEMRDRLIRYAGRHGLWGANYSLAEQVEPTGMTLLLDHTGEGEPTAQFRIDDKYDTTLVIDVDPVQLQAFFRMYQKVTSPAFAEQMGRLHRITMEHKTEGGEPQC